MDQKAKVIIVVFILLLGGASYLGYQAYVGKQMVERERDGLKTENATLQQKAQDATQEVQQLQARVNALAGEVERNAQEKAKIQDKFDLLNREKASLIEQLKALQLKKTDVTQAAAFTPAAVMIQAPPQPQGAQSSDTYWAGMLKTKTDLELKLQSILQELKTVKDTNDQLSREKSALTLQVANVSRERSDLKRQLEYNQKVSDSIASELVREKNDKYQIQDNVKDTREENIYLRRQLRELYARKVNLAKRFSDLQATNELLGKKIDAIETTLQEKNVQLEGLRKDLEAKPMSVELPPIVVRPPASPPPPPAAGQLEGKVLAVNRDNNFVVVDVGSDNGVKVGMLFSVYRSGNGKPIADVEVIQLRKNIAACDIKRESATIHIGDVVQ